MMNIERSESSASLSVPTTLKRAVVIIVLIAAGEGIFLLTFILPRLFRPTLLDVFGLTNLQLGTAFSIYGTVAMGCYLLGGPLADRFAARRLLTAALMATALGGVVLARMPSFTVLVVLYGCWGVTTILLFWAALIRATREWGGSASQGRAFGLLEGGRGLLTALLASLSVAIFAALLPTEAATATLKQRGDALLQIVWIFTGVILGIALLVWFFVPENEARIEGSSARRLSLEGLRSVWRMPAVWLQATIVVCAYACFKCTDDFSLYARDAFGYNDVAAVKLSTLSFWVRPLAAIGAGILGDRLKSSWIAALSFGILIVGGMAIALGGIQGGRDWVLMVTVVTISVGIFALRGVYYALFQEAQVPLADTGSAVGLVAVVGYTPEIFMPLLMGQLIDRSPGALGHQHVFGLLTAFAIAGLLATLLFQRVSRVGADAAKMIKEGEKPC